MSMAGMTVVRLYGYMPDGANIGDDANPGGGSGVSSINGMGNFEFAGAATIRGSGVITGTVAGLTVSPSGTLLGSGVMTGSVVGVTISSTATGTAGYSSAASFGPESSNEWINLTDMATFDGATSGTWSCWFRPTSANASQDVYGKGNATIEQWDIRYNGTTNNILFIIRNTGLSANYTRLTTDSNWSDSTWLHIVATWSAASGINIYRNGAICTMAAAVGVNPASLGSGGTTAAFVGANSAAGNAFTGHIDEIAGWANVEASSSQVSEIYGGGTAVNLNVLATMPAPGHWWRITPADSHNAAGGVIDYGTGGAHGTGQNLEAADIDSTVHAP